MSRTWRSRKCRQNQKWHCRTLVGVAMQFKASLPLYQTRSACCFLSAAGSLWIPINNWTVVVTALGSRIIATADRFRTFTYSPKYLSDLQLPYCTCTWVSSCCLLSHHRYLPRCHQFSTHTAIDAVPGWNSLLTLTISILYLPSCEFPIVVLTYCKYPLHLVCAQLCVLDLTKMHYTV